MPERTTPTSQPSSSSPPSPSRWAPLAASLPGTAAAVSAIWVIGKPLAQALPGLIRTAAEHPRDWGPWLAVAADFLALGLLVAPVPTLTLVRTLGRLVLSRNLERKE